MKHFMYKWDKLFTPNSAAETAFYQELFICCLFQQQNATRENNVMETISFSLAIAYSKGFIDKYHRYNYSIYQ